jgi:hypothetical protein
MTTSNSLAERADEYRAPVFVLSTPKARKCVIIADSTGPAAVPREGQWP